MIGDNGKFTVSMISYNRKLIGLRDLDFDSKMLQLSYLIIKEGIEKKERKNNQMITCWLLNNISSVFLTDCTTMIVMELIGLYRIGRIYSVFVLLSVRDPDVILY